MGRPAKRKKYWEGKKEEAGRLQARMEYEKKKPMQQRVLEWLQNNAKIDPLEIAAVTGMTVLIHETILHDEIMLTRIKNVFAVGGTVFTAPWYSWLGGIAGYFGFGFLFPPPGYEEPTQPSTTTSTPTNQLQTQAYLWLLSLTFAFVICRFFGSIVVGIGEAAGGLSTILKLLLPVG
jgi:hypothetical protein